MKGLKGCDRVIMGELYYDQSMVCLVSCIMGWGAGGGGSFGYKRPVIQSRNVQLVALYGLE